jgi:glucose uptake protein
VFAITDLKVAIILCVLTMLGWGSWANMQKLSDKEQWPFLLFYWDYAIGVFLFALLSLLALGLAGGAPAFGPGYGGPVLHAFASGILFNTANFLLVVAIDAAGMAVAFPIGIGLALAIGTIASYFETPKGNPILIGCGVALIILAMLFSAAAHRKVKRTSVSGGMRGLVFAIVAGCLMGFFYPQLSLAISPHNSAAQMAPSRLTPYSAVLIFSLGVLASNAVINTVFMRANGIRYAQYWKGGTKVHLWGLLGGAIWTFALISNVIASGAAGPAISYALGQGATLIAALWGVFVWKEFRGASRGTWRYVTLSLLSYALGLTVIGLATLS